MGLDMYLHGIELKRDNRELYDVMFGRKERDPLNPPVYEVKYSLAYWRKHPNLHGFIVEHFADGEDNCQEIELSRGQVQEIRDACAEPKALPKTSGCFFGESDGTERERDLELLDGALAWLDAAPKDTMRYAIYRASW